MPVPCYNQLHNHHAWGVLPGLHIHSPSSDTLICTSGVPADVSSDIANLPVGTTQTPQASCSATCRQNWKFALWVFLPWTQVYYSFSHLMQTHAHRRGWRKGRWNSLKILTPSELGLVGLELMFPTSAPSCSRTVLISHQWFGCCCTAPAHY